MSITECVLLELTVSCQLIKIPAMFPLLVEGSHQAGYGVDDNDEQKCSGFQRAEITYWDAAPRDGNIPQIFPHVLQEENR